MLSLLPRAFVAPIAAAAMLGTGSGCLESFASFACVHDAECVSGEVSGVCQPGGNCSFFDADCESTQRYGANGSPDLAGQCVPVPANAASGLPPNPSSGSSSESGTTGSGGGATGSGGGATGSDSGAINSKGSGSTSTASTSTTGASTLGPSTTDGAPSTTSEGVGSCALEFEDAFEDQVVDHAWQVVGSVVENHGELRMTRSPAEPGANAAATFPNALDLWGSVATVELGALPAEDWCEATVEAVRPDGGEAFFLTAFRHSGHITVYAWRRLQDGSMTAYFFRRFDETESVWLRIRGESGRLSLHTSTDGESFEPFYEYADDMFSGLPEEGWGLSLTASPRPAGSADPNGASMEVSFRSAQVARGCL